MKCFVSLWAELYEGDIFEIIVVRLLLLVLARAMNSRSIPLYKKMDKRVCQQLNICRKMRHTWLAVLGLNEMCDFVVYCFCLAFNIPLLVSTRKEKYC